MRTFATRLMLTLCCAFSCALLCRTANADFVVLTNGKIIEGEVVEDGDTVKVTVRGATMTFKPSQILRMGKGTYVRTSRVTVSSTPRQGRKQMTREEREAFIKRNLAAQKRAREILGSLVRDANDDAREAALRDLIELRPFPAVIVAEFLTPKSHVAARTVAARAIGRAGDGSAALSMAKAAVNDADAGVRAAAALAIGRMRDIRPINALVDVSAKTKTRPSARRAAAAIRLAGRKEAVGALISKAMLDAQRNTARGMTIGTQGGGPGNAGDPSGGAGGNTMEAPVVNVFSRTTKKGPPGGVLVLQELTGQDFGANLRAWAAWWKRNYARFEL